MNFLQTVQSETNAASKANKEAERALVISRTIKRIQRKAKAGQKFVYIAEHFDGQVEKADIARKYFKKEGFRIKEMNLGFRICW
tara:strand:- start:550 stop:801 length:252 start_codon:yes stop_codon:yes gene_type:complete